jgi:hypothetical protein
MSNKKIYFWGTTVQKYLQKFNGTPCCRNNFPILLHYVEVAQLTGE